MTNENPRPIETAPDDRRFLAFFGPVYPGWQICQWHDDRFAKKPRPYFAPDTERIYGVSWARNNQPKLWLPLPPDPPLLTTVEEA